MKQVYSDQLNPIYLAHNYVDWYRNGMKTTGPCPHLEIGFSAEWRYKLLRKLRQPDSINLHLTIL